MHEVFNFHKNTRGSNKDSNLAEKLESEPVNPGPSEPIEFQSSYETRTQPFIETSHITRDTKIIGTIQSKSHLDICGDVFGDVECENNVKISGRIEGNVKGKNVQVSSAVIKGNILAAEQLSIMNQSEILGNLSANDLELNSKVNGNINIKKGAVILKDSTVVGDITAMTVSVEKGAAIKSMVNITGEKDFNREESPFRE
jgi:cytoskeletal protein CcmA (bactofilin family)